MLAKAKRLARRLTSLITFRSTPLSVSSAMPSAAALGEPVDQARLNQHGPVCTARPAKRTERRSAPGSYPLPPRKSYSLRELGLESVSYAYDRRWKAVVAGG